MSQSPKVSVIMPVYNRENFLPQAIQSILNQTYSNFEFIIINDGSTDASGKIIDEFAQLDNRIKVFNNHVNLGLIRSLSIGLKHAQGDFIARMDSDDISLPFRFEKQIAYLESHSDIGILGTWFEWIDADGNTFLPKSQRPIGSNLIWWMMFTFPQVVHASIMARYEVFVQFNENDLEIDYQHAEDLAFWLRIGFSTKFDNLPAILYQIRGHSGRITSSSNLTQKLSAEKAIQRGLKLALSEQTSLKAVQAIKYMKMEHPGDIAIEAMATWRHLYKWFITEYSLSIVEKKQIRQSLEYVFSRFLFGYLRKDLKVICISLWYIIAISNPLLDIPHWFLVLGKSIYRKSLAKNAWNMINE